MLKAKFDGVCGRNFNDFAFASRRKDRFPETQTFDDHVHFSLNMSKGILWEEPFFGFVTPSIRAAGRDMEHRYQQLADFLHSGLSETPVLGPPHPASAPPRSLFDRPFNARLRFPMLIARALFMKARLRERLSVGYADRDWDQFEVLAGRGTLDDRSLSGTLRETLRRLHNVSTTPARARQAPTVVLIETTKICAPSHPELAWYHRQLSNSLNQPFSWGTTDLRYRSLEARFETMHLRLVRFLDHIKAGVQVGQPLTSEAPHKAKVEGSLLLRPKGAEHHVCEEEATSLPELDILFMSLTPRQTNSSTTIVCRGPQTADLETVDDIMRARARSLSPLSPARLLSVRQIDLPSQNVLDRQRQCIPLLLETHTSETSVKLGVDHDRIPTHESRQEIRITTRTRLYVQGARSSSALFSLRRLGRLRLSTLAVVKLTCCSARRGSLGRRCWQRRP